MIISDFIKYTTFLNFSFEIYYYENLNPFAHS